MVWDQPLANISGSKTNDATKTFTATKGDVGFDTTTKKSWIRVELTSLNSPRVISPIDSEWTLSCRYAQDNETATYLCRYDMHTNTHVLFEIKK